MVIRTVLSLPRETFAGLPSRRSAVSRTRRASAGSTGAAARRGRCFAPAHRAACSAARTESPRRTEARELAALLLAGHGKHRPRMTFGQLASLDHAKDIVGEIEQAQAVATAGFERPTRSATSPSDSTNSSRRTAYARASSMGDSCSAGDVLDECQQERSAVVSAWRTTAGTRFIRPRAPRASGVRRRFAAPSLRQPGGERAAVPRGPAAGWTRPGRRPPRCPSASGAASPSDGPASTGTCVRSVCAAPPIRTSRPGVAPARFRNAPQAPWPPSSTEPLPADPAVVGNHRQAVARRLGHTHRARYHHTEHEGARWRRASASTSAAGPAVSGPPS